MASIITVTFNPALDKSISVPTMVPDKKLKCSQPVFEAGGGGINVARAIKKLGGDAVAIYLSGGDVGRKIGLLLKEESVESIAINIQESSRENLVVADVAHDKQYLFDMPGPRVSEPEWQACLNTIENLPDVEYIAASGSLPLGVPADIYTRVALIARKKNAKLIVDTSGEALKLVAQADVYLIKVNLRELASLVGKEELHIEAAVDVARGVLNNGNCKAIVVSLGPHGAVLVTKDVSSRVRPPAVHTESTVGAGDSLVAGIILSLSEGKSLSEAVRYGVACGSAATIRPGTELCAKTDVEFLYKRMTNKTAGQALVLDNGILRKAY